MGLSSSASRCAVQRAVNGFGRVLLRNFRVGEYFNRDPQYERAARQLDEFDIEELHGDESDRNAQ